jgi:HAD superfamily hydrolase (TIGR01548 family)
VARKYQLVYKDYRVITNDLGKVFIRRTSIPLVEKVDGIIFDVDGVLIDVSNSIQQVHVRVADIYFSSLGWSNTASMVTPADIDSFKLAGGFNSDWDLAYAWFLVYLFKGLRYNSHDGSALRFAFPTLEEMAKLAAKRGGGLQSVVSEVKKLCSSVEWADIQNRWDCQHLQRLFVEVYAGNLCPQIYGFEPKIVTDRGLIHMDKPLLDEDLLPKHRKLGIATGRTLRETQVGLKLMGWDELFPEGCIVSEDDGFRKPDPGILKLSVERIGAKTSMYIGDTPDDILTARRYNQVYGIMLACGVLTGPIRSVSRFVEQEADIVADNVNVALVAIEHLGGKNA